MLKHLLKQALFLLMITGSLYAQETAIINRLDQVIQPVLTFKPDSAFTDLDFLAETVKQKKIIALGEVTHGTKEIYHYKDRLIRYLVSRQGYKNIAFEADYNSLELLDNYINGKLESAQMSPLYRPLFEWLKSHNSTQSAGNKVHVYGLEIREFKPAIEKILASDQHIDPADQALLSKIFNTPFEKIDKKNLAQFRAACIRLPESFQQKMLIQLIDNYFSFIGKKAITGARDAFMAANAITLMKTIGDEKLIIWAHNGHVAKTALYGKPAVGKYLDQRYGNEYHVIATDINKGNVSVRKYIAKNKPVSDPQSLYYPDVDSDKAYEYYFKQCKYKNFILDVRKAMDDGLLNSFLTEPKDMRMIGALSIPANKKLSIADNFDMVVYFNESSRP